MAALRVLIVEDEPDIRDLLVFHLERDGYQVAKARSGADALRQAQASPPDLVLLDLMLPEMDGLEVCRRLRQNPLTQGIPIVMLTARGDEVDRVLGLEMGADDYVVKPFSLPELMARVRAILRRTNPERIASVLNVGDIALDRESHRVTRNGRQVHLGPTEFRLLEFLMQSPGRVFSRTQLLDGVWGRNVYVDERTVDVHIGRLRKAMMRGTETDPVRTVRGAGYAFSDTLEETA
jgi:two-component system phosphate regulon response regulator PhoB